MGITLKQIAELANVSRGTVDRVLHGRYGVDPKRLTAAGRGEYNPVSSNASEKGRQLNRRTQIIITPKLDQFLELIDHAPETEE